MKKTTAPDLSTIVRAAIHPTIGIARVGNSKIEGPEGYYVGPEVPEPLPEKPGFFKDKTGALKRQAAKFRVYGLDKDGKVVAELNVENASVEWTVHVANKKAAWYEFQIALDIPEATTADPSYRRNAEFQGKDRAQLVIDPGAKTIQGASKHGKDFQFNGTCVGKPVYLGELQTDKAGHLIFLGGHGVSESFNGSIATTFANNDGWYDDTSDGPVTAAVKVGDRSIPCDPAWVVTAPPNYAPDIKGVRTLHDLLRQVMTSAGMLKGPSADQTVSFEGDVLPILQRLSGLQWVNKGFASQFGWGGPFDFNNPELIAKLGREPGSGPDTDIYAEFRLQLYNAFRNVNRDLGSPTPWPWIYGDAMEANVAKGAAIKNQNVSLTPIQMATLKSWAGGKFTNKPIPAPVRTIDAVPLVEQPATLDRASLDFCLADAFHPGCEVTWPIRTSSMYMGLYRILHKQPGQPEPDFGDILTPAVATAPGGPLYAQGPGDLSRWMAVPWQADTSSCRSGYDSTYDPYLPTFWPARVPNQVLASEDYAVITNPKSTPEQKQEAFAKRAQWLAHLDLDAPYLHQVNKMVSVFGELGVVERRSDHGKVPGLPEVMYVESAFGTKGSAPVHAARFAVHAFPAEID